MKIKICGITKIEEAEYLNEANVDYAGFVFYEKSKRNVTIAKAQEIFEKLAVNIKKVAVMVSPEEDFIKEVEKAGFDILQIHKELKEEVINTATLPIWYAVNISDTEELERKADFINQLTAEQSDKIKAIVVDAPDFGSGKTFNWRKSKRMLKAGAQSPPEDILEGREFILAGGLNPTNVAEGISCFSPDAVDVSSGVEGNEGKDNNQIQAFVKAVRMMN